MNATAFYEHDEPVGRIDYPFPFHVPPGLSRSPRLPVDLDFSTIGYGAIKEALGGSLKMNTLAEVGVRIGHYRTMIDYSGRRISAHIRL